MSIVVTPLIQATKADWEATNQPIVANRIVYEADTGLYKIGDGTSTYSQLPYVNNINGTEFLVVADLASLNVFAGTSSGTGSGSGSLALTFIQGGTNYASIADLTFATELTFTPAGSNGANSTAATLAAPGIATNASAIAAETTRAEAAESTLSGNVSTLQTDVSNNTTAISTEKTRAESAEAALSSSISTLQTDTSNNATAITNETSRAEAAEALLVPKTDIGAANGVAPLDGTSKVPLANLPASVTTGSQNYIGSWNAATNTPTITSGTAAASSSTSGTYYIVDTSGTTTVDGVSVWAIGDWIIWNDTLLKWTKLDGQANPVASVVGLQGPITAAQIASALGLTPPATAPFGTTTGTVADGGALESLTTTVNGLSAGNQAQIPASSGEILTGPAALGGAPVPVTVGSNLSITGGALNAVGAIASFQGRTVAAAVLESADVTGALGYTPVATDTIPYDIGGGFSGTGAASQSILYTPILRAITFSANLAGSAAIAKTAATASTVFTIYHNGTNIGTLTYAAASTTGTFSVASGFTTAAGDVLEIIGPATADTTLANVSVSLFGLV